MVERINLPRDFETDAPYQFDKAVSKNASGVVPYQSNAAELPLSRIALGFM